MSTAEQLIAALDAIAADESVGVLREVRLAPGVYRLNTTMVLTPAHSNTAITAPDGEATLTGSRLLSVQWKQATTSRGITVWAADIPPSSPIDALHVGGNRATRARYPNANPETDQFPTGWVTGKTESLPPVDASPSQVVNAVLPHDYPGMGPTDKYGPHGFAGVYRAGVGGACSKLTPPESYWCQPDGRTAGRTYFYRTPSGIANVSRYLPHAPYAGGAPNATVFYWRPGHWFTIMYDLAGPIDPKTGNLLFGHGGFQGAEGHDTVAE